MASEPWRATAHATRQCASALGVPDPAPAPAAAGSAGADPTPHFAPDLFAPANIHRLHTEYDASAPFKHTLVEKLFQDDLLQKVKDEALAELSFSEKETDIYKVRFVFPAPSVLCAASLRDPCVALR